MSVPVSDLASSNLSDCSPKQAVKRRSTSETPSTLGARRRTPASLDAPFTTSRVRVAKRARKAINCGPCRLSKLKCDRGRPCSSCMLRGTSTSCYYQGQGGESPAVFETDVPLDVPSDPRSVNTAVEFTKIYQGLALIEAHVDHIRGSRTLSGSIPTPQPSPDASIIPGPSQLKESLLNSDPCEPEVAPGARGESNRSGLYAGPTSTVSHLTVLQGVRDGNAAEDTLERTPEVPPAHDIDCDLYKKLPPASVIDGLVDFYFGYCNWVYRNVNNRAFMAAWARYKSGAGADRTVLATVCMIMAVTTLYLPAGHELLRALPSDIEELGAHYYNIMRLISQRKQTENRAYTLELVELLLIRSHYLMVSKTDSEETWHVKGELVNIATAMGLHRDPGRGVPLEVAERRRWAWWNILMVERWHAYLLGRPIAIASHHFDTRLPSYCDPEVDPSGKLYNSNFHTFRLAFILGNIMDDAVSLRPVSYESLLAKDRTLQEWWDKLPTELDMDDYTLVSLLSSSTASERRIGVQSVVLRTAFLHIRFGMHRPYAILAHETSKYATSLEIAINTADKLIAMSSLSRPELLNQAALGIYGHMTWAPIHCLSAAMFFCFQIINNPENTGAGLMRASVLRAIATLESCRGMRVAEKALDILRALGPLYTEEFISDTAEDRERKKQVVLPAVRRLRFPCVDSPRVPIGAVEGAGSGNGGLLSPALSSGQAVSPRPRPRPEPGPGSDSTQPSRPSVQGTMVHAQEVERLSMPQVASAPPSLGWPHADLAVGDPARYLEQGQQGRPAAMQQQREQQYRNAALPPRQPAENEEAVWRSVAHHAPAATMVHPEAAAPAAASSSRARYEVQDQMVQQDAYGVGGSVVGLGVGVQSDLWGAIGFVPGEWERMYTGLWADQV